MIKNKLIATIGMAILGIASISASKENEEYITPTTVYYLTGANYHTAFIAISASKNFLLTTTLTGSTAYFSSGISSYKLYCKSGSFFVRLYSKL